MQIRYSLLAFLFLAVLIGCSPGRKIGGEVSGNVEFAGKPLNYGAITIIGEDRHAEVSAIKDGKYQLKTPPFGKCKLTILTAPPPPPEGVDWAKYKPPADYREVPERYGRPETSQLEINVTEAPQTHHIKLTR